MKSYITFINEAKKDEEHIYFSLDGRKNENRCIAYMMEYNYSENRRNNIIQLIKSLVPKKIKFNNRKTNIRGEYTRSIEKERIIVDAYWVANNNSDMEKFVEKYNKDWKLYLVGTKKDYLVDLDVKIGYYEKKEIKRVYSIVDPYGEEDWNE